MLCMATLVAYADNHEAFCEGWAGGGGSVALNSSTLTQYTTAQTKCGEKKIGAQLGHVTGKKSYLHNL